MEIKQVMPEDAGKLVGKKLKQNHGICCMKQVKERLRRNKCILE